jgi:membrane protein
MISKQWGYFKQAFSGWQDDNITSLSAALAYYAIFSIAPLIFIAVALAGIFFGQQASQGQIYSSIAGLMGNDGAKAIESFVKASSLKNSGVIATVIGLATLLIGATSMFAQLQFSLNQIWKVQAKKGNNVWSLVRQRLLSFSLILIIGFLLLVSLLTSAILAAIGQFASENLPGGRILWEVLNFSISFGVTIVLFAAIYKILPDVKLKWRDVWAGGIMTAFLFTVGKLLIGLYLGHSGINSTYGAAGSVVIILLWTYYSSAALLFGAEFTRFYSEAIRGQLELKDGSEWITPPNPGLTTASAANLSAAAKQNRSA